MKGRSRRHKTGQQVPVLSKHPERKQSVLGGIHISSVQEQESELGGRRYHGITGGSLRQFEQSFRNGQVHGGSFVESERETEIGEKEEQQRCARPTKPPTLSMSAETACSNTLLPNIK